MQGIGSQANHDPELVVSKIAFKCGRELPIFVFREFATTLVTPNFDKTGPWSWFDGLPIPCRRARIELACSWFMGRHAYEASRCIASPCNHMNPS